MGQITVIPVSLNGSVDNVTLEVSSDKIQIKDGAVSSTIMEGAGNFLAPIGAIFPWLKSFTNTPALPTGWVECDGSVLSDADSVFNGQTLPDLNGSNYFLKGSSTSGNTGGSTSHRHQWHNVNGSENEAISMTTGANAGSYNSSGNATPFNGEGASLSGSYYTSNGDGTPPNYEVVYIMRIK